ncbi:Na(+)-translocating NADH-quinone reductase subunit C [Marinagarivorans algicola]|uniref:Na(+)-translocating NADH-quinone reductase subunit C n=1 Tax=Marinagarivorans algicola TaxID=1513270 RepID=UPI0006B5E883|nr:Na(+)-translocating NADH-quinone reductase subunit C [Marinagarivorans algicola]
MSSKDSIAKTLTVATLLCVVCSVIVSTAAVLLKPAQIANKELDFKRNILSAAGLLDPASTVEKQFENIVVKMVDLETGKFSTAVSPDGYDQTKAAKEPSTSQPLPKSDDIAKIGRVEDYAKVYIAQTDSGKKIVVLPVRGYGLWGTLYGFLAVEGDMNTVVGLGFYDHKETPGLGGEVDNPRWKALWPGKKLFNPDGSIAIAVIKGSVDTSAKGSEHKVDGLSGATLTTKGVHNLIQFWLGEDGYGPFIANMKKGKA